MTEYRWSAPSNIAFVKYWGKKEQQIPMNGSISGTLSHCRSKTSLKILSTEQDQFHLEFYFAGEKNESFAKKIENKFHQYFLNEIPLLKNCSVRIESENSFPHSCGIASSASFYASLALCLVEFEAKYSSDSQEFLKRASYLARLGSGSACRSLFGPFVLWGGESMEYAEPIVKVHQDFKNLKDFICLISSEEKSVSSTLGHSLMDGHPYRDVRIEQANMHLDQLKSVLEAGDWSKFSNILEQEANQLHALMMCSTPGFFLLKEKSFELIQKVRQWREQNSIRVAYTIDAGPNIHLICHSDDADKLRVCLEENSSLLENCRFIEDEISGVIRNEHEH